MRQVFQNLRSGETLVEEVPAPAPRRGVLVVQTRASLISAGTERMLVDFSRASWVAKARSQPDKVKQVLEKLKTDGLEPTLEAVFSKLDEPMPLGYCNAGIAVDVGSEVPGVLPGDRITSNGSHAELVGVPRSLCAKIPDGVSDEQASFTVLGSIGLQGVRLLEPTLGERFVVYGLGLIGLLSVQILRAHGCEVLGIDLVKSRLELAKSFGAEIADGSNPEAHVEAWTRGQGADGVLITASTKAEGIMHAAATMCRKRGRIVLVGVVPLDLRRDDFYKKELSFQVSCSYGPGRYDESYEQQGHDYPLAFVRWTEQRNFEAVLQLMATGRLAVDRLITHRFPISEAPRAYEVIRGDSEALGVLLTYDADVGRSSVAQVSPPKTEPSGRRVKMGIIGAGSFTRAVLLRALQHAEAHLAYVASRGPSSAALARRFNIATAVSDHHKILEDPTIDAVVISTRHASHAKLVAEALAAGKHVFVEKPLAVNEADLELIRDAAAKTPKLQLMVGFNRRFSRHTQQLKQLLAGRAEPLCLNVTINAGAIPADHWVHEPAEGGRIIGEGCHFIDLVSFLAGAPVRSVSAMMVGGRTSLREDKTSMLLSLADGSIATINYFANGSKKYPKETIEVFSDGRVARIDNFRETTGYGFRGFQRLRTRRQDKGHAAELTAFADRVRNGGAQLIPLEDLVNTTKASFAAVESARSRTVVSLL
ncbi:MAG: bi-domain-containing oxidoreductase [Deltaproteobacteria bacterium]|nr:bi-domain-containing oxidoreductase [Deltaproteobacteria bacterium]